MTKTDLVWLACCIDCEGSITLLIANRHRSPCYAIKVQVANTNRVLLRRCQAIAGCGGIYSSGRRGKNYKPCYQWSATTKQAAAVLTQVLPYLVVKRRQARIAIEAARLNTPGRRPNPHKPRLVQLAVRMKALNHRGSIR